MKCSVNNAQFSKIVSQYQGLVYTVCFQLVRDHQLAEDLTQETFLSAFLHIDSCPPDKYRPWLARIASNKATDHLRSAWHRRVETPGDEDFPQLPGKGQAAPPGPEDIVVTASEAEAIRGLVNQLKEPYLLVSQLYFLQERSIAEISKALRRPPKTVSTQLFRAKKLLREKIRERSDPP